MFALKTTDWGGKCDRCDFDHGMDAGVRWTGSRKSEIAELLRSSHTTVI